MVATLNGSTPEQLRDVATYAEELAELKERETHLEEEEPDQDEAEERPDDVPAKATITIKEINDNRYYYWQWRDGDQVRSPYKSPVNSDG